MEIDDETGELVKRTDRLYEAELDRCPGCEQIEIKKRNMKPATNRDGLYVVLSRKE